MIALGSDHAGLPLKKIIRGYLDERGVEVEDVGTHDSESCDYPDFAFVVAEAVSSGRADSGVLVCGTGTGMAIAANKVSGARAAMCSSEIQARLAREHNDANILALGARLQGDDLALAILQAFMDGDFAGGRHARRVQKINARG